jgi:hypothetical protein
MSVVKQSCEKPADGLEVFRKLAAQFADNFTKALVARTSEVARVEIKARCLASVGELLRTKCADSPTRQGVALIYDEVFADCVCSMYLAAQGLDKPAQLVLRRVLELGLAAVYLWDQPHLFWGWKELDQDLSFNDIAEHLSSPSYLKFVVSENGGTAPTHLFDVTVARREYRVLSNTVHGKISTFESPLVDRFRHSDSDWQAHLSRVEKIQDLLLDATKARFRVVRQELSIVQPQIVAHS